jgi:hypothetical protein
MRKSIIASLLDAVNSKSERELTLDAKDRYAVTADEAVWLRQVRGIRNEFELVVGMTFMSAADVQWEFEGGSAEVSSRLLGSALNTAYTALFWSAIRRDGVVIERDGDKNIVPLFDASEYDNDDAPYAGGEQFEALDYDDALMFASAVLSNAEHISRFDGGKYKWLLRNRLVLPFSEWARDRAARTSPEMAPHYREYADTIKVPRMSVEESSQVLRQWLDEPLPQLTETRRERIVHRVGNSRWGRMIERVREIGLPGERGLKAPGEIISILKVPELILAAPDFHIAVQEWKGSQEYAIRQGQRQLDATKASVEQAISQQTLQLQQINMLQMQKQLVEMQQQFAANQKLIDAQMAQFKAVLQPEPKAEEPKAERAEEPKARKPKVVKTLAGRPVNQTKTAMRAAFEAIDADKRRIGKH